MESPQKLGLRGKYMRELRQEAFRSGFITKGEWIILGSAADIVDSIGVQLQMIAKSKNEQEKLF